MEKRKNQLEQGQPMEQTRGLFCMYDSGVARCQSRLRCGSLSIITPVSKVHTGKYV